MPRPPYTNNSSRSGQQAWCVDSFIDPNWHRWHREDASGPHYVYCQQNRNTLNLPLGVLAMQMVWHIDGEIHRDVALVHGRPRLLETPRA